MGPNGFRKKSKRRVSFDENAMSSKKPKSVKSSNNIHCGNLGAEKDGKIQSIQSAGKQSMIHSVLVNDHETEVDLEGTDLDDEDDLIVPDIDQTERDEHFAPRRGGKRGLAVKSTFPGSRMRSSSSDMIRLTTAETLSRSNKLLESVSDGDESDDAFTRNLMRQNEEDEAKYLEMRRVRERDEAEMKMERENREKDYKIADIRQMLFKILEVKAPEIRRARALGVQRMVNTAHARSIGDNRRMNVECDRGYNLGDRQSTYDFLNGDS